MTAIITKHAHISAQFPDQEAWDIYASLLTDVLRKVVKDDALHSKFCRVTQQRGKSISVQLDALYGFAEKYDLLGVNTDGLL